MCGGLYGDISGVLGWGLSGFRGLRCMSSQHKCSCMHPIRQHVCKPQILKIDQAPAQEALRHQLMCLGCHEREKERETRRPRPSPREGAREGKANHVLKIGRCGPSMEPVYTDPESPSLPLSLSLSPFLSLSLSLSLSLALFSLSSVSPRMAAHVAKTQKP